MIGAYESDNFSVSYNGDGNYVSIVWKNGADRDSARTNSMLAAELISKHEGSFLVVDHGKCSELNDDDRDWIKRILIPAFVKAGLKKCYFVEGDSFKPDFIYSTFSEKFEVKKIASVDEIKNEGNKASNLDSMTREEALEYMGLPSDSNNYAIDEKFWALSKKLRGSKDENAQEKLDELSAVYDIAIGNRDKRRNAEETRSKKRKFLGKTASEWGTYFSYTWYKYVLGIVIIALACNLCYHMFFQEKNDVSVIAVGHISVEDDSITEYLTNKLGYENPYFNYADVVVDNDEDQTGNAYSDQTASVLFLKYPDVIITDEMTYKYYYEAYMDMTDIYQYLIDNVSPEIMAKVKPVYCSEYEYHVLADVYDDLYDDYTEADYSDYSRKSVMVGLEITDPDVVSALGIYNLWNDEEPSVIFSVYNSGGNYDNALAVIKGFIEDWGNY